MNGFVFYRADVDHPREVENRRTWSYLSVYEFFVGNIANRGRNGHVFKTIEVLLRTRDYFNRRITLFNQFQDHDITNEAGGPRHDIFCGRFFFIHHLSSLRAFS